MNSITILVKPNSGICNLRCSYCFYTDEIKSREVKNYGIMDHKTIDKLAFRISEYLDGYGEANICFQGGEPLLSKLQYYKYFVKVLNKYKKIKVNYSIQTNGTLLDEDWASFFSEHHFLVGISLDGYQVNMDQFRYDPQRRSIYFKVLKAIDLLNKYNVDYNILTVLTTSLARHPESLFRFYNHHHLQHIQLIPCLPPKNDNHFPNSLAPNLYESFYTKFFKEWKKQVMKGKIININFFENWLGIILGNSFYQCGMNGKCIIQNVIEADGSIFPCDFYCEDKYKLGNIYDSSFRSLTNCDTAKKFLKDGECKTKACKFCKYIKICNGGCRRQNVCYLTDEYCAQKNVLDKILPELYELIKMQN